jgi:predicted transcriptional regulator
MDHYGATQVDLTELTTAIVAGFVANDGVAAKAVPAPISLIHSALAATASARAYTSGKDPVAAIHRSITPDSLIYLEDNHKLRSFGRYIQRKYVLSPEAYRARWNLPPDYPMVAPGYSKLRSKIATKGSRPESAEKAPPQRSPSVSKQAG